MKVRFAIIGAGPTGLGAANRLLELGEESFVVLERAGHPGGLAASFKDDAGFTWDIGGHVLFSHYPYFDGLMQELLGGEWLTHQRESWVRVAGGWVPYPFQNNVRHLPRELCWECLEGLMDAAARSFASKADVTSAQPANFREWFESVFGAGIARLFMASYNFKVWATPPELMDWRWIGERVSVVDVKRAVRNVVLGQDDVGWGPNSTFLFPEHGGTGEIFRRLAARLGERVRYDFKVSSLDPAAGRLTAADGRVVEWEQAVLSTMPLDLLAREVVKDAPSAVRDAASRLDHNGVHVTGVGVDGSREDSRCWMYFPTDEGPFYRVTNFHNYSPQNCAKPGAQRALMCETSFSPHKPEDLNAVSESTLAGLENVGLLDHTGRAAPASLWTCVADYGYPVPTLARDPALSVVQPWLESRRVFSRGRFGGWKYEVGNMDHSVMQGVEWAERMLRGGEETTYKV